MTTKMDTPERVGEIVDDLERYKMAVDGVTDLKVGPRTISLAFEKAIRLMLDMRDEIVMLRKVLGETARREADANARLKKLQN